MLSLRLSCSSFARAGVVALSLGLTAPVGAGLLAPFTGWSRWLSR
jgi:hypothetical protein